jgi:hypothetical protein
MEEIYARIRTLWGPFTPEGEAELRTLPLKVSYRDPGACADGEVFPRHKKPAIVERDEGEKWFGLKIAARWHSIFRREFYFVILISGLSILGRPLR